MSKYINADEAIKVMACEMYAEAQSQGYDVDGVEDFIPEATAWMNDAPSIDIVKCNECVHGTWNKQTEMYICSANDQDLYEAGHFCSYGERREP